MRTEAILRRRHDERRGLLGRAQAFADALPRDGLLAVVVFGSVARGDFNIWSDVDVLVVVERSTGPWSRRTDAWPAAPGGVQAVVWTASEWNAHVGRGNPIAVEALAAGVWLVGSPEEPELSAAVGRSTP